MRPSRIAWPGFDARPSHITALRNFRLAVGSGRRYIDADVSGAPQRYGSSTVEDLELRASGDVERDANQSPLAASRLKARRRLPSRRDVGAFTIGAVVGAEDRIESVGAVEAIAQFRGRDAPALRGLMTRHAAPSVGPERLEERVVRRSGRPGRRSRWRRSRWGTSARPSGAAEQTRRTPSRWRRSPRRRRASRRCVDRRDTPCLVLRCAIHESPLRSTRIPVTASDR